MIFKQCLNTHNLVDTSQDVYIQYITNGQNKEPWLTAVAHMRLIDTTNCRCVAFLFWPNQLYHNCCVYVRSGSVKQPTSLYESSMCNVHCDRGSLV